MFFIYEAIAGGSKLSKKPVEIIRVAESGETHLLTVCIYGFGDLDARSLVAAFAGEEIKKNLEDEGKNLQPLFQTIVESVPAPKGDPNAPLQLLINNLDHDDYLGRLAIGRVMHGTVKGNQQIGVLRENGPSKATIKVLSTFEGLKRTPRGRFVTPEEVARLVRFACSPAAEGIVGQTLVIDGGARIVD